MNSFGRHWNVAHVEVAEQAAFLDTTTCQADLTCGRRGYLGRGGGGGAMQNFSGGGGGVAPGNSSIKACSSDPPPGLISGMFFFLLILSGKRLNKSVGFRKFKNSMVPNFRRL